MHMLFRNISLTAYTSLTLSAAFNLLSALIRFKCLQCAVSRNIIPIQHF